MKALSINNQTLELQEIDINMAANTVYSFFNSILIDELESIKEHIIYSDANALSEQKTPYFIGEQLILGDVLIVGREEFNDVDTKISKEDLTSLVNTNVNAFYKEVLALLSKSDINLYRTFEVQKSGETIPLNVEWVLYTFNIADDRTKKYFIDELSKILDAKESVQEYVQKMAQLAMNVAG